MHFHVSSSPVLCSSDAQRAACFHGFISRLTPTFSISKKNRWANKLCQLYTAIWTVLNLVNIVSSLECNMSRCHKIICLPHTRTANSCVNSMRDGHGVHPCVLSSVYYAMYTKTCFRLFLELKGTRAQHFGLECTYLKI